MQQELLLRHGLRRRRQEPQPQQQQQLVLRESVTRSSNGLPQGAARSSSLSFRSFRQLSECSNNDEQHEGAKMKRRAAQQQERTELTAVAVASQAVGVRRLARKQ